MGMSRCWARLRRVVAVSGIICVGPAIVYAAEHTPRIEVSIPIEVQNDWSYDSDDPDNEHNQLFTKIEPEATVHLIPGLTLVGHAVVEPMRDPDPGEDRAFEDHGVFVEDFYVDYGFGRYGLRGGKFTPAFGIGWDIRPGIYGNDFAEAGYEFSERIGFAGRAGFEVASAGAFTVTAHTFFLDTTILSESLGRGRGTTERADGGVSNTEDLSSYSLTLDGENVAGIDGLGTRISYIRQAKGEGDEDDEIGFSAALWHEMKLGKDLTLSPVVEYVHFEDAEGIEGQDRDFLTAAGRLDWRSWNLTLAYTGRDTDASGTPKVDDYQFQVSAGYLFEFGLEVDVGWHIVEESDVETRRLGTRLSYTASF